MGAKTTKPKQVEGEYLVVSPFADITNFSIKHEVGDNVSHFGQERLQGLMDRGLVDGPAFPVPDAKAIAKEKADAAKKIADEAAEVLKKAEEESDRLAKEEIDRLAKEEADKK